MKRSELFFTAMLVPLDFLMISLAFYLAYAMRLDGAEISKHLDIIAWVSPLWLLFFALSGLYSLESTRGIADEFKKVFVGVSAGVTVVLALGYLFPNHYLSIPLPDPIFPSKTIPLWGWLFAIITVSLGRLVVYAAQKLLFRRDIGLHRAVLFGNNDVARRIIKEANDLSLGYRIVAGIDGDGPPFEGRTFRGWSDFVSRHKEIEHIDELIITDPVGASSQVSDIMRFCSERHIDLKFIPTIVDLAFSKQKLGTLGAVPIVHIRKTPLEGWGRIWKRITDLLLSSAAIVILSPLLLLIALLIKLTSKGAVFFTQERAGKKGNRIRLWKFRTMRQDAEEVLEEVLKDPRLKKEWQSNYKLKNDPRVTNLGRVLRKTSLDELPQLFNVVLGQMSLVGPRPVTEEELLKYGENTSVLLALKPGLTGLWQIAGRSDVSYEDRVKLDMIYIENWSPWLDFYIMIKTAFTLLRGAY